MLASGEAGANAVICIYNSCCNALLYVLSTLSVPLSHTASSWLQLAYQTRRYQPLVQGISPIETTFLSCMAGLRQHAHYCV